MAAHASVHLDTFQNSAAPGEQSLRLAVDATKEALIDDIQVLCQPVARNNPSLSTCSGTDPFPTP